MSLRSRLSRERTDCLCLSLFLCVRQSYEQIYGSVVHLAWPRAFFRFLVLNRDESYEDQVLCQTLKGKPSTQQENLRRELATASGFCGGGFSDAALEALVDIHLKEFSPEALAAPLELRSEGEGEGRHRSVWKALPKGLEKKLPGIEVLSSATCGLSEEFRVDADVYLFHSTGVLQKAASLEERTQIHRRANQHLERLLFRVTSNAEFRLQVRPGKGGRGSSGSLC